MRAASSTHAPSCEPPIGSHARERSEQYDCESGKRVLVQPLSDADGRRVSPGHKLKQHLASPPSRSTASATLTHPCCILMSDLRQVVPSPRFPRDGGVLVCIHPAGWPFHAPTTAAARAESWRRQVRDSQESKGKRMAYALVRPRAATVAGARGSVRERRGGRALGLGSRGTTDWKKNPTRQAPTTMFVATMAAHVWTPDHPAVLAASAPGRTLRHRMVGTPGAPVSAHSLGERTPWISLSRLTSPRTHGARARCSDGLRWTGARSSRRAQSGLHRLFGLRSALASAKVQSASTHPASCVGRGLSLVVGGARW